MVWDKRPDENKPMTDHERDVIGRLIMIPVPMESKYMLRFIADKLRGLAEQMHFESHRADANEADSLLRIKYDVKCYKTWLKEEFRRHGIKLRYGRPTDMERLGQSVNGNGTDETIFKQ